MGATLDAATAVVGSRQSVNYLLVWVRAGNLLTHVYHAANRVSLYSRGISETQTDFFLAFLRTTPHHHFKLYTHHSLYAL